MKTLETFDIRKFIIDFFRKQDQDTKNYYLATVNSVGGFKYATYLDNFKNHEKMLCFTSEEKDFIYRVYSKQGTADIGDIHGYTHLNKFNALMTMVCDFKYNSLSSSIPPDIHKFYDIADVVDKYMNLIYEVPSNYFTSTLYCYDIRQLVKNAYKSPTSSRSMFIPSNSSQESVIYDITLDAIYIYGNFFKDTYENELRDKLLFSGKFDSYNVINKESVPYSQLIGEMEMKFSSSLFCAIESFLKGYDITSFTDTFAPNTSTNQLNLENFSKELPF